MDEYSNADIRYKKMNSKKSRKKKRVTLEAYDMNNANGIFSNGLDIREINATFSYEVL